MAADYVYAGVQVFKPELAKPFPLEKFSRNKNLGRQFTQWHIIWARHERHMDARWRPTSFGNYKCHVKVSPMRNLFNADAPKIYTMPPRVDFLGHLADGLQRALGEDLHTAMILLPTRRAARELSAAFLKTAPTGGALLLPTMRTLADMDENEPPFTLGSVDLGIAPSIDGARYRFELAKLVAHKMTLDGMAPDASASLAMTEPLVNLLTDLAMEELGPDALVSLNDEFTDLPAHFQNAAEFAQIIAKHWPEHLRELGLSGLAERKSGFAKCLRGSVGRNPARPSGDYRRLYGYIAGHGEVDESCVKNGKGFNRFAGPRYPY